MNEIHLFKPKYRRGECLLEIGECLDRGWTGLGYKTIEFEDKWKDYSGYKNAHFLNSSTSGLFLTLELFRDKYGWGRHCQVITTPLTFVSTNHAILNAGLTPVFADVDETLNLSPASVEQLINESTVAVMFVGIGGNPDNYREISHLCKRYGLRMILDAAHMAGTKTDNSHYGTTCDAAIYSFQAVKNLPISDSGMVCFLEEDDDHIARKRSWLGIDKDTFSRTSSDRRYKFRYNVEYISNKYHGNALAACLGIVGLRYLDEDNNRRRQLRGLYTTLLSGNENIHIVQHCTRTPHSSKTSAHLFQIVLLRCSRDNLIEEMNDRGIFPGVHYISNLQYSAYKGFQNSCPRANEYSNSLMSLPLHLFLTDDDVRYVARSILEIIANNLA